MFGDARNSLLFLGTIPSVDRARLPGRADRMSGLQSVENKP